MPEDLPTRSSISAKRIPEITNFLNLSLSRMTYEIMALSIMHCKNRRPRLPDRLSGEAKLAKKKDLTLLGVKSFVFFGRGERI